MEPHLCFCICLNRLHSNNCTFTLARLQDDLDSKEIPVPRNRWNRKRAVITFRFRILNWLIPSLVYTNIKYCKCSRTKARFADFCCLSGVRAGVICTSSLTQCSVPLTAEARVRSHVVLVMGRVGLGQVSLRAPQLSAVSIMPPVLRTHPLFICFNSAVKTLNFFTWATFPAFLEIWFAKKPSE